MAATILCIDDEPRILELLIEELIDHGYQAHGASGGHEGLAAILRLGPDVVICDVNMPDLNGFELLERLRALSPQFAAMPFIFLSALGEREDILRGRRLGADDYVTKPIDFEMLLEIVKVRLSRPARAYPVPKPSTPLTQREIEALTWSARGKSSADIAVLMQVSERTVNFHIANAMQKFGVATRIQAAVKASLAGIIKD